jgi:hypothetical protein
MSDTAEKVRQQLELMARIQGRLQKLRNGDVTDLQARAVRDLVAYLEGYTQPEQEDRHYFTEADLHFLDRTRADKVHPEVVQSLKVAMRVIVENPSRGVPFTDTVYAELFKSRLPEHSGKVLIFKMIVRRKYRLIYAYGGSVERPLFIAFEHRKDIYKHVGFGHSSS